MNRAEPRKTWQDVTTVIIAGGPSLHPADLDHVRMVWGERGQTKVIAINESWRVFGLAHIVYGADASWWKERGPKPSDMLAAELWTQDNGWQNGEAEQMGLKQIRSEIGANISLDPSFIYQGANSSFQAMNLAILFGSRRIVFLGLDMSADGEKTHWHSYPEKFKRREPGYSLFRKSFETAAPILAEMGVEVINASRRTALECFPRVTIQEALKPCG